MSTSVVQHDPLFEAIRSASVISESQPLRFWDGGKVITITQAKIDPEKELEYLHTLTTGVWDDTQEII